MKLSTDIDIFIVVKFQDISLEYHIDLQKIGEEKAVKPLTQCLNFRE